MIFTFWPANGTCLVLIVEAVNITLWRTARNRLPGTGRSRSRRRLECPPTVLDFSMSLCDRVRECTFKAHWVSATLPRLATLDVGEKAGRACKDGYGPFRIDRLRRQQRGKESRKDEQTSSLDRISPRLASERGNPN